MNSTTQPIGRMVDVCLCGENESIPWDLDGDGIGEACRRCGDYISIQWREGVDEEVAS